MGDNERFVGLIVWSKGWWGFVGMCKGKDEVFGDVVGGLVLGLVFEEGEGERGLGSGWGFGNIDEREFVVFQILGKVVEIMLRDVVWWIENKGGGVVVVEGWESV